VFFFLKGNQALDWIGCSYKYMKSIFIYCSYEVVKS